MLQSEDLVRGATTWTKTTISILQFGFHYITAFPFQDMAYTFPGKRSIDNYSTAVCALLAIIFILEYRDDG